jgi:cytosine/adenosine deaminase-related metal-dependent hydrolase
MSSRTLLRGGHILSIDRTIGELPEGDILIDGPTIVDVGPHIDVEDAEIVDISGHIVAPGMIDTHRHTWQTQLRAICGDWTLADYFYGIRLGISPAYEPSDVYLGNKLGAIDALNSGVTTILDFSHCNNTPQHSDAAVHGLLDAGIRAKFCYGFFESNPYAPPHFTAHTDRLRDFERIAAAYFGSDGLITLGVSLSELGLIPFSDTRNEIAAARHSNALIATHMGCVWSMPSGFDELSNAGLLGPDMVHIHCNTLTGQQFKRLADSGGKVSISVETELSMGMGRPVFSHCEEFGLKPTLSCDVTSLNSGDLITQIRMGLGFKRWSETEHLNLNGVDPSAVTTTAMQALEWSTVNAAAAIGMESKLGTITPGKQADLMIVGGASMSQHPHIDAASTLIFQTSAEDVRHVLVAGEFVKRDGILVGHDLATLTASADRSTERILGRVAVAGRPLPGTPEKGFDDVVALAVANLAA